MFLAAVRFLFPFQHMAADLHGDLTTLLTQLSVPDLPMIVHMSPTHGDLTTLITLLGGRLAAYKALLLHLPPSSGHWTLCTTLATKLSPCHLVTQICELTQLLLCTCTAVHRHKPNIEEGLSPAQPSKLCSVNCVLNTVHCVLNTIHSVFVYFSVEFRNNGIFFAT